MEDWLSELLKNMVRKEEFPKYEKIDIDPDNPPDNYFGSARRCIACGLKWPNEKNFYPRSVCCGRETRVIGESPNFTWKEAVKVLLNKSFEEFYEKYNGGLSDEELMWTPTENEPNEEEIIEFLQQFEENL